MKRKDFALRMKEIKQHVRLIDASFVSGYNYPEDSLMISLVNELESLAVELRVDLTHIGLDND